MFKNIGKEAAKDLGNSMKESSTKINAGAERIKEGLETASKELSTGLKSAVKIFVFGWIIVTLLKN